MKALVTGASGFIGSHLVELLVKKGYDVRILARKASNLRWLEGVTVEQAHGDFFDPESLRKAVEGVDYVYHNAGVTKAKLPEEYYRGNTETTKKMLEAVLEANPRLKRFVLVSSQAAEGPSASLDPVNEEVPPHQLTTYGRSKWEAEKAVNAMADRLPVTIVRPPVVYGPRDRDVYEFFTTVARGLQPVVGFKEKYVSLIHAADLVRGFVMAAESDRACSQTYFISSKRVYSWGEIGDTTKKVMGKKVLRVRVPEPGVYVIAAFAEFFSKFSPKPALINFEKARDMVQDYWTCSAAKAKRDFGFEQQIELEEGIRETVEWYRQMKWL